VVPKDSLQRFTALFPLALLFAMPLLPQQAQQARPQQSPPRQGQGAQVQTAQGQLDASPTIFAVMVALDASGFDTDKDSATNSPLRRQIRDHFAAQNYESLGALRRFVRDHRLKDPGADLGQYMSYALSVGDPPSFEFRYDASVLPPDVARLDGFTPLLAAFYRDAHLSDLWKQAQPFYDQAIAQLHDPVALGVLQANLYLRNSTSGGYLGRRFQIYVDLFGPPNQVQTRSYLDDYFVVVTPATDPPVEAIRHSYLHYLLDPVPMKFSKALEEKRGLADYALGSPILEDQYKTDFILLTTECLIKAVESRIDRKPAQVEQALREGFVLTPALAEQLVEFEKQDVSLRLYFPEMIGAIDLAREEQRLDHIDFASERASRRVRTVTREVGPPELTGAARTLADAEKAYTAHDLPKARDLFLQVLKQTEEKSTHAKAYYGLARITVLERDPETGDRLFRKVLELEPDPETKSWSLLYLGRLADSQNLHDEAVEHYQAVLAVEGAPETVRKAAEQGLKEAFVKK
jgi:tetratricopeptide (TPR) repeat protein